MSKYTDDVIKYSNDIRKRLIEIQNEELAYKDKKIEEIRQAKGEPTHE